MSLLTELAHISCVMGYKDVALTGLVLDPNRREEATSLVQIAEDQRDVEQKK